LEERIDGRLGETEIRGFGKSDHPRLGHGDAERDGDARAGGDLELASAGAKPGKAGEQGGAWDLPAAAHDQQPPPLLLVPILGQMRHREGAQQVAIQLRRSAHRAAIILSGAEVTGAASSIKGAAKL
jgi:hypothetical protein